MRKCSVTGCFNDKTRSDCRDKTFFRFPLKNAKFLELWLKKISRQNFKPSASSVVCSDHFEENSFTICPFTKRRVLKQDAVPKIFKKTSRQLPRINLLSLTLETNGSKPSRIPRGAVPTVLPNSPFPSSESLNSSNPVDKGGAVSLQDSVRKGECEPTSALQKADEKLNSQNAKYLTVISNKNVILLPLHFNQSSTTTSGNESQKVPETPTVIKQEPDENVDEPSPPMTTVIKQEPEEYTDEPPLPVIEKVVGAKRTEIVCNSTFSSNSVYSDSSSSTCGGPTPILQNPLSCTNLDSNNMDKVSPVRVVNKPAQKRKISDTEIDAVPTSAESCQLSMPPKLSSIHILRPTHLLLDANQNPNQTTVISKKSTKQISNATASSMPSKRERILRQHSPVPPTETTKKSEGSSRAQNDENVLTETFQTLFEGSENDVMFDSRIPDRPGDLFDVFADFVAGKLRGMDWDDCAHALRTILEVVSKPSKAQHDSESKGDISNPNTSPNQV